MPLVVSCPGCPQKYQVPDHAVGKTMACKKCGQKIAINPEPAPELELAADPFAGFVELGSQAPTLAPATQKSSAANVEIFQGPKGTWHAKIPNAYYFAAPGFWLQIIGMAIMPFSFLPLGAARIAPVVIGAIIAFGGSCWLMDNYYKKWTDFGVRGLTFGQAPAPQLVNALLILGVILAFACGGPAVKEIGPLVKF
jgi:hypothetical protein